MTEKETRFEYRWVILVVCFMMVLLVLGFCSSNVGLYTKAVTEALNIKRSVYSLALSIRYVAQAITALYFGTLTNRFGLKKMACVGMLTLTASVLVRACATRFYHLYFASVLWGFGIIFSGGTMASTIVRRWFPRNVGRYTGIIMSANGLGGALASRIISPLINNGETFGYRKAYLLSAAVSLAVTVMVILLLREQQDSATGAQSTDGKKKTKGTAWVGIEYAAVKKKPYFYALAGLIFLTGITLQSIGNIGLVYMADIGMPAQFIANCSAIGSLTLTFTKILTGASYDRFGLRCTLLLCQIAAVLSFLLKWALTNSTAGMVMALVSSSLSMLALPLETVMLPLLTNDLFGSASYTKVLGVFMAMNSLGLCLGSPLGDLHFDIFGTYKPCFWFFSVVMVLVIAAYQFVLRAALREKESVLSKT